MKTLRATCLYLLVVVPFLSVHAANSLFSFSFVNGSNATLNTCRNAAASNLASLLTVSDNSTGTTLTWSVVTAPAHGTLAGFPASTVTNGGSLSPSGTTFAGQSGYSGSDAFVISVTDGSTTQQITVNVTIGAPPQQPTFTQSQTVVNQGQTGVVYSVASDPAGTSYNWIYIGSGVTINSNNTNAMTMDFANNATSGTLYVQITGPCGNSPYQTLNITVVNQPMPVTLVSFTAVQKDGNTALNWVTASEVNSDYFAVERSTDGQHFTSVKKIKAAGNSFTLVRYSYTDSALPKGKLWYRLRQVDIDEKTSFYSPTRFVGATENAGTFTLSPNPVLSNDVEVSLGNLPAGAYTISVYSTAGRLVAERKVENSNAGNSFYVPLPNAAKGVYLVQVHNQTMMLTAKLIKQ